MHRTNKFRLYPNKKTENRLLEILELHRQTYNLLLAELQSQKVIDKSQIQGIIPDIKICESKFKQLYSKSMQYECYKLFSNLKALAKSKSKRRVGRLRFKGKGCFKTFTYNQSGFKLLQTGKRYQTLYLSKIGNIPIKVHRGVKGRIKQITIKREASGKWYAYLVEERSITIPKKGIKKIVGIDLGLINFVYDSEGDKVTNPKHLKKRIDKLGNLQRKLAKKEIGSNNRIKAKLKVARQYERVVNSRDDFLHKLSRYYVDNYDVIGMEDIIIANMVKSKLAKHIFDVSWGKFRQMVSYKAESAGKRFLLVNHKGTTKRCSQCGNEVAKELDEREHKCNYCGFKAERDYNSALEIRRLCLQEIGKELAKSTLAKMEALSFQGQLRSLKQEAPRIY